MLTSSFAVIGYGHKPSNRPFTEQDWTDPNSGGTTAYVKSKTVAERAAWDFIASDIASESAALELAVVNPVGILGPVLGPDYSTSIEIVRRLMEGAMPGVPRLSLRIVDVRDVADLHLRAVTNPAAVLKARVGVAAERVPTRVLPDWLVRIAPLFDKSLAQIVPELGTGEESRQRKSQTRAWLGAAIE